jgi:hypothetical protein
MTGAEREAAAPGGADQPEIPGAIGVVTDVADVRTRRRIRRAEHAGERAADEQPAHRSRETRQQEIHAEREQREQQQRPAAEAVAQVAEDRRHEELQQCVHRHQIAAPVGGNGHGLARELHDHAG